jgi:hypothetical protein
VLEGTDEAKLTCLETLEKIAVHGEIH